MTPRLTLRPLPADAAVALPDDRESASRMLCATLHESWPEPELLDVLPLQAAAAPDSERFGVWLMIERDSHTVVGDLGFVGPPDEARSLELGYSVVPERRRRGYAAEAVAALVTWALELPTVSVVLATCDDDNVASIRTLERIGFVRTGAADGQIRWRRD